MKKIITISREFGSGGRSIGRAVAKKLGYACYDKEFIEKLAGETGLSADYIEKSGETSPGGNIFSYAFVGRTISGLSVEDYLWKKQRDVILNLAEKGNCVIVGRCSDYILKDRADCLNVFIHADLESRIERVVKKYGQTDEEPEKRVKDKDKKRQLNYEYYTDRAWGICQNYHVALDSNICGIESCVDIITQVAAL